MPIEEITLSDVYTARQRIAGVAIRTPLMHSPALSDRAGAEMHLKLESLQNTGSFKLRGATNKLFSLSDEEKARGVITVSSGNHGRAVAYAARSLGINATICLAEGVARNKLENIKKLGPEVVVQGKSYDEAVDHSLIIQKERELTYLHPFDDPVVIAGQGTAGLEIVESLPDVDTVLVPLSGGGLICGIALAVKAANPNIRVIGVSMEAAPVMYHCLKAGKIVTMPEEPTIADALPGGLGPENHYTFRLCQELLDDVVLVSEEEIAEAMAFALEEHRLVVEGGAAVGIAAAMHKRAGDLGERAAVVVSGSNVDLPLLLKIAQEHGAAN